MRFGAHMSIAGGAHRAFARGERAGCDVIQIFSKNQQQWRAHPLDAQEIALFRAEGERSGICAALVHASYLINLASPDDALWQKSTAALGDELARCAALGIPYLVMHPGAHVGSGEQAGICRVADALGRLLAAGAAAGVTVLLETTAGQGTCLGHRFAHLAQIIERCPRGERLGVCVDTCHIFAAGYDIRTRAAYERTLDELDRTLGLERVRALHLNDSLRELGSRVDRHTHIGEGRIGLEGFRMLVNDPRLAGLPAVLETPKGDDLADDIRNLQLLRSLMERSSVGA